MDAPDCIGDRVSTGAISLWQSTSQPQLRAFVSLSALSFGIPSRSHCRIQFGFLFPFGTPPLPIPHPHPSVAVGCPTPVSSFFLQHPSPTLCPPRFPISQYLLCPYLLPLPIPSTTYTSLYPCLTLRTYQLSFSVSPPNSQARQVIPTCCPSRLSLTHTLCPPRVVVSTKRRPSSACLPAEGPRTLLPPSLFTLVSSQPEPFLLFCLRPSRQRTWATPGSLNLKGKKTQKGS